VKAVVLVWPVLAGGALSAPVWYMGESLLHTGVQQTFTHVVPAAGWGHE
jgi:hypothetical protein